VPGAPWSAALAVAFLVALVGLGWKSGLTGAVLVVVASLVTVSAFVLGRDGRGEPETVPGGCDPSCGVATGDIIVLLLLVGIALAGVIAAAWALGRRRRGRD
jgi:hypothetical protein